MQKADRPRSKPGTDFQSMRQKARAGQLRGKTFPEDRNHRAPTTEQPHGKRDMTVGTKKSPLNTRATGHNPETKRYPRSQKIV